jgi:hypothetical protein
VTFAHAGYVFMLHLQRISKILIRIVLLLLIVQFVTPAFANVSTADNATHEKTSYKNQHDSGILVSVLLKENSEEKTEGEGDEKHVTLELLDLSFHTTALKQSHAVIFSRISHERQFPAPLFKLNCVFLI